MADQRNRRSGTKAFSVGSHISFDLTSVTSTGGTDHADWCQLKSDDGAQKPRSRNKTKQQSTNKVNTEWLQTETIIDFK